MLFISSGWMPLTASGMEARKKSSELLREGIKSMDALLLPLGVEIGKPAPCRLEHHVLWP